MVDALHHAVGNLLSYLHTHVVGGLLLVVAGICTVVETLDEGIHVGSVNLHLCEIFLQTLGLCHTHSIAEGIDVGFEVGLLC